MNKRDLKLEDAYVASPCSASWESMNGDDRSRNCSQCDRTVYNISGLSRREASELIANRAGRMCIRLHRRADGTVMTNDCPKGLRAYRIRVAKYAGSVFAAVIGLFSVSYTQRMPTLGDSQGMRSASTLGIPRIEGSVKDPNGDAIPFAEITITTSSGKTIVKKADRRGRFSIANFAMETGKNQLEISANGFGSFRDSFSISRQESIDYQAVLEAGFFTGVVVVKGEGMIDMKKSGISTTIRFDN